MASGGQLPATPRSRGTTPIRAVRAGDDRSPEMFNTAVKPLVPMATSTCSHSSDADQGLLTRRATQRARNTSANSHSASDSVMPRNCTVERRLNRWMWPAWKAVAGRSRWRASCTASYAASVSLIAEQ